MSHETTTSFRYCACPAFMHEKNGGHPGGVPGMHKKIWMADTAPGDPVSPPNHKKKVWW